MALVTAAQAAATGEVANLPGSLPGNKDRYSTRIKKAEAKLSKSSGNAMIEMEVEIYSPDVITSVFDKQRYNVAGVSDKTYFTMTDKALPRLFDFMRKIGIKDPAIDTDIANTDVQQFVGKCFSAIWSWEESIARKDLTEEEKLAGKSVGDPIMMEDGVTPVKFYRAKMGTVLGGTNMVPPVN